MENEKRIERFVDDLKKEIVLWASHKNVVLRKISTVYFGGGTPTILSARQLGDILQCVKWHWDLDPHAEVTVEATPESAIFEKLAALKESGVTRVSMGVQSLVPRERTVLGLTSEIQPIFDAVQAAKDAGLTNINLDVMYGLPGQTLSSWNDTLQQVLQWNTPHLSCYALSIEEGTRFSRQLEQGVLRTCEPEEETVFQIAGHDQIQQTGLTRYEISNWAQPGYACQHNLRYWQGMDYLGIGPSAQSYVDGVRWGNAPDMLEYVDQLQKGYFPVSDLEVLDEVRQRKERVIFGLRQVEGVPADWVDCPGYEVKWTQALASLLTDNLLLRTGDRYMLTAKGRILADTVGQMLW